MHPRSSEHRSETTPVAVPPIGRLYDVGGRRLLLHHSGTGGPAVVIAPGAGAIGLDYLNVHDQASAFTTSVLYDRAGTGWSHRVDLPRTAAEVVDELRDLLRAADVPAPYLLVGHSLGGLYVRHYAQRFPDEVAGLLLLDPAHEDFSAYMPKQLLDMQEHATKDLELLEPDEELLQLYRGLFAQMFARLPEPVREVLIDYHIGSWRTGVWEAKNVDEIYDEVRHGGDIPDVPLIVLTAMGLDRLQAMPIPEQLLREMNDGKRRLYEAVTKSVPRGEQRVLLDAGHTTIHTDRPDAVLQAIRDLLDRARG
jgi:pimeloyl-ACP methyl ester carboxylesterase